MKPNSNNHHNNNMGVGVGGGVSNRPLPSTTMECYRTRTDTHAPALALALAGIRKKRGVLLHVNADYDRESKLISGGIANLTERICFFFLLPLLTALIKHNKAPSLAYRCKFTRTPH